MNEATTSPARSPRSQATRPRPSWTVQDGLRFGLGAVGAVVAAAALWWARNIVLLIFAGALFGLILYAASERLTALIRLPRSVALAAFVLLLTVFAGLLMLWAGAVLVEQFEALVRIIAQTAESVLVAVAGPEVLRNLDWEDVAGLMPSPLGIATGATAVLTGTLGAVTAVALVLIFSVFFAATPQVYTGLIMRAAGPSRRDEARAMLEETGIILRWWLKGQLAAMVVIGGATYAGLLLIGMPFALPLALFAGLTNFIPYIGPFISGIAILLVAIGEGTEMVIWAIGLYVVIQSFESGVLVPLIQSRAVRLPPVVVIASQLLFGAVFGILGVMLATPIAAAATVPLRRLFDDC